MHPLMVMVIMSVEFSKTSLRNYFFPSFVSFLGFAYRLAVAFRAASAKRRRLRLVLYGKKKGKVILVS
jgi:hypothetical protein